MNDYKLINVLIRDGSEASKLKLKMIVDLENIDLRKVKDKNFLFLNLFEDKLTILDAYKTCDEKLVFGFKIHGNSSSLKISGGKITREIIIKFEKQFGECLQKECQVLSYVRYSDFKFVLKKFRRDFEIVFSKHINAINNIPKKMVLKVIKRFENHFKIGINNSPNNLKHVKESFAKLELAKRFKEDFEVGINNVPYFVCSLFANNEDEIFEMIKIFKNAFSKSFINNPDIIQFFPTGKIIEIVEMFKPEFEQIFTEDSFSISYINYNYQKQVMIMFPNIKWG